MEEAEEAHHALIHQYRQESEHPVARVVAVDELLEQIRRLESHSRQVPRFAINVPICRDHDTGVAREIETLSFEVITQGHAVKKAMASSYT